MYSVRKQVICGVGPDRGCENNAHRPGNCRLINSTAAIVLGVHAVHILATCV